MMQCKCDFFIVGAPKAGTTTLARYLNDSPEICFSIPKEVNYFSGDEIKSQSLYYADPIITSIEEYRGVFQPVAGNRLFGEGSVSYLFYPDVPRKIHEYNPSAKIIAMVRDPAERAFSHYLMDSRLGYLKASFEEVFYNKDEFPMHYQQYFSLGLYGEQIERYINVFGREQVLVLSDSDLRDSPEKTLGLVFSFLGVDRENICFGERAHNEYKAARSPIVEYLYQSHAMRVLMRILLSRRLQSWLKGYLFTKKDKPVVDDTFRRELQEFYRDDINRLSMLLGRDFSRDWLV